MAKPSDEMNEERKSARSKAVFLKLAGIGPDLAEFVTELIAKPEKFYSIDIERRRELENRMDTILSSFGQ